MGTIWTPKINVFGMILWRDDQGNYVANVKRAESLCGTERVPWDIRVGQNWLAKYPDAWVPA